MSTRKILILAACACFLFPLGEAKGQTRRTVITDRSGSIVARVYTDRNGRSVYWDRYGRKMGTSMVDRRPNIRRERFADRSGRYTGQIQTERSGRVRIYDRHGDLWGYGRVGPSETAIGTLLGN